MKDQRSLNPLAKITAVILSEVGDRPLSLVLLVIGMTVTYLEYQASIDESRVEKSFQMVEEWESRGYSNDFDAYSNLVLELEAEATAAGGPPLPYIQRKLIKPSEDYAIHIANLYYFFDKVSLCIDRSLCDGPLLEEYFGNSIRGFWEHTIAYLETRRERVSDFGRLTEALALSIEKP